MSFAVLRNPTVYNKFVRHNAWPLHGLSPSINNKRSFFLYLKKAFNAVDEERLKQVGSNRLCAEWIIKNGGSVLFENEQQATQNYNALPNQYMKLQIKEIDASESSVMSIGFDHFKGCAKIEKIKLHNCKHMENDAIDKLGILKDSLIDLQISGCYNVNESGLKTLKQLINLQKLTIFSLPYVKNLNEIELELKNNLPKCQFNIQK